MALRELKKLLFRMSVVLFKIWSSSLIIWDENLDVFERRRKLIRFFTFVEEGKFKIFFFFGGLYIF